MTQRKTTSVLSGVIVILIALGVWFYPRPSLEGWYYYTTDDGSDSNTPKFKCFNPSEKDSSRIAGVVLIKHENTLFNQTVSFDPGTRMYCKSANALKPLDIPTKWSSLWAVIKGEKIYAKLIIGGNMIGFLEATQVSGNNSSRNKYSFEGSIQYLDSKSSEPQIPFIANIKFKKCNSSGPDECEKTLKELVDSQNRLQQKTGNKNTAR